MKDLNIRTIGVADLETTANKELLIEAYADECKCDAVPMINPNFNTYHHLQSYDALDVVGMYDGSTLVGFAGAITVELPKYSQLGTTTEFVFVLKEYRKYNAGLRLINELERRAKDRGSVSFFISAPVGGSLDKIATRSLGLTKSHIIYSKQL